MTNYSSAVADLQARWFKLSDLDRARAVFSIKQTGVSIRNIASQLHLSESLMRHLILALRAPLEDLCLARKGIISTNQLTRNAREARTHRSEKTA